MMRGKGICFPFFALKSHICEGVCCDCSSRGGDRVSGEPRRWRVRLREAQHKGEGFVYFCCGFWCASRVQSNSKQKKKKSKVGVSRSGRRMAVSDMSQRQRRRNSGRVEAERVCSSPKQWARCGRCRQRIVTATGARGVRTARRDEEEEERGLEMI